MANRSSNHSIDRFLLVTVMGWFYREYYLFTGKEYHFRTWLAQWSEEDKEPWFEHGIIHPVMLARAMNVCVQETDAALLQRTLPGGPNTGAQGGQAPTASEPEEVLYAKLKAIMQIQYAGVKERETLRRQLAAKLAKDPKCKAETGIHRKTVSSLVGELTTFEERLEAMPDQDLADWLAARVQGFRLRRVKPGQPLYHIEPVGQPAQQMAAVQAAYYPYLDKLHTDWMLDMLGLTSERRQSLMEISDGEEKPDSPTGRWESGLAEQLNQALTAVETVRKEYGIQGTTKLFWYELTYHSWQCQEEELTLVPRERPIPILPWQVVYSNGYFYLCGLRLDLPPQLTGGDLKKELVFSNLRLDRIRDLHRVKMSQSDVDYKPRELRKLVEALYQYRQMEPMTYRDVSTIMYSGTPESLVIDCDPALLNSAVDDFGRTNIQEVQTLEDGRVRISVKGAVWGGARQWLLQHAGRCCLTPLDSQADHCRELAETLRRAAESYEVSAQKACESGAAEDGEPGAEKDGES